jgi:cell division septum initiation protein DivIVA
MEANEESVTPQFATVVRGYDRLQVDDYVEHLQQWIEQADNRAQQSEAVAADSAIEVEQLRRRVSSLDADSLTATPESMKALGSRVGTIMQSSFTAAKELHARAEDEARATETAAESQAERIIVEATARAEELSRAAEDLFAQAQDVLAGAVAAATRQVDEASARGQAESAALLERARAEVQELARNAAAEESATREQVALLEEHRQHVLDEIALLQERLGTISDGFSAAPQLPPPPERASLATMPQPASQRPDDETVVLELPSASRPNRRKAASSTR